MSLVSIISADAAAEAVAVNPILHDSGWKSVTGNSLNTDLENLTFSIDTIIHIYAKAYRSRNFSYYTIKGVYSGSGANSTDTTSLNWRPCNNKGGNEYSSPAYQVVHEAFAGGSPITGQSAETRNSTGFAFEKDTPFVFNQISSASTSYGIQYRIVVERSDGAQMVKWATNS